MSAKPGIGIQTPKTMAFELRNAVFPILPLSPDADRPPRVYCDPGDQGSAFFISRDGLFLTAKHVVGRWSTNSYVVMAFDYRLKGHKDCRVQELERHPEMDIAIGIAQQPGPVGWLPFKLGGSRIGVGSAVFTFGYANSKASPLPDPEGPRHLDEALTLDFYPRKHAGHVVQHLPGWPTLNAPCYVVSCDPGGGISGAPLIRKRTGSVHGMFNTGIPASEGAALRAGSHWTSP